MKKEKNSYAESGVWEQKGSKNGGTSNRRQRGANNAKMALDNDSKPLSNSTRKYAYNQQLESFRCQIPFIKPRILDTTMRPSKRFILPQISELT